MSAAVARLNDGQGSPAPSLSPGASSRTPSPSPSPSPQPAKAPPPPNPEEVAQTLLFYASTGDPSEVIRRLDSALLNGVDIDTVDAFGNTLLHWACSRGHSGLTKALLERRANVNIQNTSTAHTPLHWAAVQGSLLPALLLCEAGAEVDTTDQLGRDALFYAVANQHMPLAHLLLLHHSPLNVRDHGGNTALHWAVNGGDIPNTRLLIAVGFDLDITNLVGETALMVAARQGHYQIFRYLLRKGADPLIQNPHQETALDLATGQTKEFIETQYKICPPHFQKKPRWTFRDSQRQGVQSIILYALLMVVGVQLGYIAAGILAGILYYVLIRAKLVPYYSAPDEASVMSHCWLELCHTQNVYLWWTLFRSSGLVSSPTLQLLYFISAVLLYTWAQYFLWKADDPGYMEPTPEADAEAFYRDIKAGQLMFNICPSCRLRVPLRSKHCRFRDQCVYRYDHYCQFVNKPIGLYNHRAFFVALTLTTLSFGTYLYLVGEHFKWAFTTATRQAITGNFLLTLSLVQGGIIFFFMLYLWLMQVYYIATGYTMNEVIGQRNGRYQHLFKNGQPYTPFSRGSALTNLTHFFFQKPSPHQFYLPEHLPPLSVGDVVVQ